MRICSAAWTANLLLRPEGLRNLQRLTGAEKSEDRRT